jgi:hypothetical protein
MKGKNQLGAKISVVIISVFFSVMQTCIAAGSLGMTFTWGEAGYSSTFINASVYTPEYEWGFDASYSESGADGGSESDDDSRSYGVSRYFDNGNSFSFGRDIYNGFSFDIDTFRFSTSLLVNQWFSYEKETNITLSYDIAHYIGNGKKKRKVNRDGYTFDLSQSITDIWTVGGSYTKYHYDVNPKRIQRFFFRHKSYVGVSIARGLVKNSWSLYTGLQITDKNYISLSSSRSNNAIKGAGYTDSLDLYNSYSFNDQVSIGLSVSRVTPKDGDKSYYYSLSSNVNF